MELKSYVVYCHTNILNGKKYIGITSEKPQRRWRNGDGYKNSLCFYSAIIKYGWNNFTHEILFDNLTQLEAEEKEIYLIQQYNTISPNGYNIKLGGNYGTHTESTKEKLRLVNLGKVHTIESRLKMSKSRKGIPHSDEHREKYKGANNPKAKVTEQLTLSGELIKVWGCAQEAANTLGFNGHCIRNCCNKKYKTYRGFIWRYSNEN